MKKFLYLTLSVLLSLNVTAVTVQAAAKPVAARTSKTAKTKVAKSAPADSSSRRKVSKYDRTFVRDRNCTTARCDSGFVTIHKKSGKLYLELPVKYMDREMLIASTITGSSAADLAAVGYKPTEPLHVKFSLADTTVLLKEVNVLPDFDESNREMKQAVARSCTDPIIAGFKVFCWNKDSSAVVFNMTKFFTDNNERMAPVKSGSRNGISVTATPNSAGNVLGDIKAFKDNITIKSSFSYTVTADFMKLLLLKNKEPFTVDVTRTILLLPEKKMRPRMADSRVGIFGVNREDFDSDRDQVKVYSVIKKWDVQPSDTAAWKRGELVEPVKPIVYYVDSAFPRQWRDAVKAGALRWNKAFERIGLKDVVRVEDFPENDPQFDPDNLKYSCIRYVPSRVSNAMGPSWCDRTSGEIINASVIVYNDVVKMVNSWRFVQTSQLDERARKVKMPEDLLQESIEYVVAHEVGHTLGFMHNMAASAAYPVESLRSPSFTAEFGTTASIMDYARFNYVAQPSDKGVRLDPPVLGPYDYWLVEYAYKPVPEAQTMKDEAAVLESWTDAKAGDPIYRYGRQQVLHRYDPSANSEDLGNDPIKASDYGIANLKYILAHFKEWMNNEDDPDASVRAERYEALCNQYSRYIGNVMLNIGGVYLTSVKPGTPGRTAVAVDKAVQKASVKWVLNELKNSGWLSDRSLTNQFPLRLETPTLLTYYTALELFSTVHNVMLSSQIADSPGKSYDLASWCDDMYDGIWESAIKRRSTATRQEKILQSLYVQTLLGTVTKKSNLIKVGSSSALAPSVDRMIVSGFDEHGYIRDNIDALRALDEQYGTGYVASQILEDFGKYGPGWQAKVNLRTVDNSKGIFYAQILKIQSLLKSSVNIATGDTKAHYQSILFEIQQALDKK